MNFLRDFAATFGRMILHPYRGLTDLEDDPQAGKKGVLALLLIIGIYTLELFIFIQVGYPAANPSVLPILIEEHYRIQFWYQGPLFFLITAITSLLLAGISHPRGNFPLAFARMSFATVLPFALTMMLVELAIALLLAFGVLEPTSTLAWLKGNGRLFANLYQSIGLVWLIDLIILAAKVSTKANWFVSALWGFLIAVLYGLPIGLFIR